MLNNHKLSLAIIAYSEKFGTLKLNNFETFAIHTKDIIYQVITNKKKEIVSFEVAGVTYQTNQPLILFIVMNPDDLVKQINVEKINTENTEMGLMINRTQKLEILEFVTSKKDVTGFVKQFENADLSSHKDYLFEQIVDLEQLGDGVEIVNSLNNVYFMYKGIKYGNTITRAYYCKDTNIIYGNHNDSLKSALSNLLGNLKQAQKKKEYLETRHDNLKAEFKDLVEFLGDFDMISDVDKHRNTIEWLSKEFKNIKYIINKDLSNNP